MRAVKFRAKLTDRDEWLTGGGVLDLPDGKCAMLHLDDRQRLAVTLVQPETVGQYTGLKDKNGKEIYDSDVVSFKAWKDKHQGTVRWNDGTCGFEIEMSPTSITGFFHDPLRAYEVIGNIHQNPELLSPEGSK